MDTSVGTTLAQNTAVWDSSLQCFISSKHQQLAEMVSDYNRFFSLVFIPPKDRDATDTKPYAILDSSPGLRPHIIRYLSVAEVDDPVKVIGWIFEGDMSRRSNRPIDVFQRMEAAENARKLVAAKAEMEAMEERVEKANWLFGEGAGHAGYYAKMDGRTYRR